MPIHCGCIMSEYMCFVLDFGGVACISCAPRDIVKFRSAIWNVPETQQHLQNLSQVHPFDDTRTSDSDAIFIETMSPRAPTHEVAPTPEIGESFHGKSLYRADLFYEGYMGMEPEEDTSGWIHLYPQNLPEANNGQLQQANINSKPALIPLFEKVLVPSDADPDKGMLFLPKLYAETYFPELSSTQKVPLLVQDIMGIDWHFLYGVWWKNGRKIYALEGLKGFMTCMQLKPGDKVTFYRMEPEKKLAIRLQRAPDNE